MTDRDYEIEISTLRAELAEVKSQRSTLHQHVKEALELLGVDVSASGYVPDSWTLREQCKIAKSDRDDWRDIAIGLRDFGGPPLPSHAAAWADHVMRYEAKIKKGG